MVITTKLIKQKIIPRLAYTLTVGILAAMMLFLLTTGAAVEAQSPCGASYPVVYGDTLRQIADRCDTTISAILRANPTIENPNLIYTGTRLAIPSAAEEDPAGIYTIKRGDTLRQIAFNFNTTVAALVRENPHITNPNLIYPGQQLAIPSQDQPVSPENPQAPVFSQTQIYLIALEDNGQNGQKIGCNDSVVPVQIEIEPTRTPLTATIKNLLAIDSRTYGQSGLYNALYQSKLQVQGIDLENGRATVNLTGTVSLGGVCDNPRFHAQLEQTALQFPTVDQASIFINGRPLDEILSQK